MGDTDFIRQSLFMIGGLLIWAAHFTVIYIFTALACERQFAGLSVEGFGIVPVVVLTATGLALLATIAVIVLAFRRLGPARAARDDKPVNDFMRYTTITVAALSLVAIAWNGLPSLIVSPCG